jgi:uncharacterized protein YggE
MKKALILLSLFILLLFIPASTADKSLINVVTATGEGEAEVTPDVAYIVAGVDITKWTANDAQTEASKAMNDVIKVVKAYGITDEKIKTIYYNLSPQYTYGDKRDFKGYELEQQIRIEVSNLADLGPIIDSLIKAGGNLIKSINFDLKNDSLAKEEALQKAIADARQKVDVVLKEIKVKFDNVQSVEIADVSRRSEGGNKNLMMAGAERSPTTPINPGLITIAARVNVVVRYKEALF